MTSHRRVHTKYAWDRKFTDNASEYEVARLNHFTNHFYKHHRLYRILGVERHTWCENIALRGKILMDRLEDTGSKQYKEIEYATKRLSNVQSRLYYDQDGDQETRGNLYLSKSQKDYWDHMREPENMTRDGDVYYTKTELAKLASLKDEHGAASGKLSTHNQFGSARTWNPYLI